MAESEQQFIEDTIEDQALMEEVSLANQLAQEQEQYQMNAGNEQGEDSQEEPAKMSVVIFLPLLILCVITDVIDFFTGGTIGWLIGLFVDGIILIVIGFSRMGRKQFRRIAIGLAADSFPLIATVPFRTIFLCWGFLGSRSKVVSTLDRNLILIHNRKIDARNRAALNRLERSIKAARWG